MCKLPFNHFMIWCRNWYMWDNISKDDIIKNAQKAFELDGYLESNDAAMLSLKAFEMIMKTLDTYNHIEYPTWDLVAEIHKGINLYKMAFDESVILAVRNKLAYLKLGDYKLYIAPEGTNGLKYTTDDYNKINRLFKPDISND